MEPAVRKPDIQMFQSIITATTFSLSDIEEGRRIFNGYKAKGTVRSGSFEDDKWWMTSEYSNVGIKFEFDESGYNRHYITLFGMDMERFALFVKTFLMFSMGRYILETLQKAVNELEKIIATAPDEIISGDNVPASVSPSIISDFLSALPVPETSSETIDLIIESLEQEYDLKFDECHLQRDLATFDSYFLFRDVMDDFWANETDEETKLFYAPLYFWWHITGVIPMRPREFLVTDRNCLEKRNDGYYLSLRKDLLKGRSTKTVGYCIAEDFKSVTYKITDKLGKELERYIALTSTLEGNELGTLFRADMHYRHWKQKKHSNSRYYTYINLSTCLRYFYDEIICGRYKLRVVQNQGHLEKGTIGYIHLGDTRHISLINIMMEGGTPVIAMALAGHKNFNMESWYSSNLTRYVECQTYSEYRRVINGKVEFAISHVGAHPAGRSVKLDNGGFCFSSGYPNGNYDDCAKAIGPAGEIACCAVCNMYSKNAAKSFIDDYRYFKARMSDQCTYIGEVVRQYRTGKGEREDIIRACMNLKNTLYSYKDFCRERSEKELMVMGDNDGEEKTD